MEAIPVDVALGSFRVDVLTVGKVETPVIVLGVVGAVGSGSSIVSCQFQIGIPLFLYFLCTATRALMLLDHKSNTILPSKGSCISRSSLEISSLGIER